MKKRTKISIRTKIYLTIAGLLTLTGILDASNPTPFTGGVPFPNGVAAAPDLICPNAYSSAICNLGAFANFAVLVLDSPVCPSNVDFSSPDTLVQGDIGLCGGTSGAIKKLTVDGDIVRDTTPPGTNVTIANNIIFTTGHGVQNQDLSAACGAGGTGGDCRNASQCASGLPCTQNVGDLTTSMTFTGNGGLNVICINNINLTKATITIQGGPSDTFIFNVTGPGVGVPAAHNLNQVKTTLVGVTPSQILWNVTASGTTVKATNLATRIVGTWLVPNGSLILDKGVLNGSICAGCTVRIHSAARLICQD